VNLLISIMKELHALSNNSMMRLVIHANLAVHHVGHVKIIRIIV